ncbi:TIGR03085 family metal-binding protein [soil metagenome]
MTTAAGVERQLLCDLFDEVGPDQPTLSGEWTTRDLAAHIVVRERRPDAGPGIISGFLAGYSEKVRLAEAAKPYAEIVERIRQGPPMWNPMHFDAIDRATNTIEFFVHHEDVRRAQRDWTVRTLSDELTADLRSSIGRMGGLLTRGLDVGLTLRPDEGDEVRLRTGEPVVALAGPVGEGVLYVDWRRDVAQVTLYGPDDAVATVSTAQFGI